MCDKLKPNITKYNSSAANTAMVQNYLLTTKQQLVNFTRNSLASLLRYDIIIIIIVIIIIIIIVIILKMTKNTIKSCYGKAMTC